MDTFRLKVFAITVMLIDHIGAILVPATNDMTLYFICRLIGRLAFPIFAFLIAEGFLHTSNVKRYMGRLLVFAFVSEIPYDMAFYRFRFGTDPISDIGFGLRDSSYAGVVFDRLFEYQNIFFTLFLGLVVIYLFELVDKKFVKKDYYNVVIRNSLDAFLTVAFCGIAFLINTDYKIAGILTIITFYLFRESKLLMAISIAIINASLLCDFTTFSRTGNWLYIISIFAVLGIIPIWFYNGKKGKSIRYFFYAFYPVHLLCLYLIAYFI